MSLYEALKQVKSEEDVKDAYIKALGLKGFTNGLIDIQTNEIWKAYFSETDVHTVRDTLKLNKPYVGWYQVRNALKSRNESGDYQPMSFTDFENAYKELGDKLRPQVYEYGFLR